MRRPPASAAIVGLTVACSVVTALPLPDRRYSQYVWQAGVDSFLRTHAAEHRDSPFFLFYALQTVHSPLEAPAGLEDHPACASIPDPDRRTYCAMVLVTDAMVENTFAVLGDTGLDDTTLVLFSADNGGNPSYGGYNMPLRGRKGSVFEGGVRSAAFVWGKMLPEAVRGTSFTGLIHLTDWLPTFMGTSSFINTFFILATLSWMGGGIRRRWVLPSPVCA